MVSLIRKIIWFSLIGVFFAAFGNADYYMWKLLSAGTGMEAKLVCSGFFISSRPWARFGLLYLQDGV